MIDVVDHVLAKNPQLEAHKEESAALRNQVWEAGLRWTPSVSLNTEYVSTTTFEIQAPFRTFIRVTQPLWNAQLAQDYGDAKYSSSMSELDYRRTFRSVLFEVTRSFLECGRIYGELALMDSMAVDLVHEQDNIAELVKKGFATSIDSTNLSMQLQLLELERTKARTQLTVLQKDLSIRSEIEVSRCEVRHSIPFGQQIAELEPKWPKLNQTAPELEILNIQRDQALTHLQSDLQHWLPNLSLYSERDILHERVAAATQSNQTYYGLQLTWRMGLDRIAARRRLNHLYGVSQQNYRHAIQDRTSNYSTRIATLKAAILESVSYENLVLQAEEVYQSRRSVFLLGHGAYLEVLRSKLDVFTMQKNAFGANYKALQKFLEILYEEDALDRGVIAKLSTSGRLIL